MYECMQGPTHQGSPTTATCPCKCCETVEATEPNRVSPPPALNASKRKRKCCRADPAGLCFVVRGLMACTLCLTTLVSLAAWLMRFNARTVCSYGRAVPPKATQEQADSNDAMSLQIMAQDLPPLAAKL